MGNLCSSGTERSDKKEDNRVPDKPRDGEDEALLSTTSVGLGVGPEGVQVSVEAAGGQAAGGQAYSADGLGEIAGGTVKSSDSAFTDVTTTARDGGQIAAAAFQRDWEKAEVVDVVQKSVAGVVTESAGEVKAAAEDIARRSFQEIENKVTDSYQSATGKLEETAGDVRDKVVDDITNVENFAKSEAVAAENEAEHLKNNSSASFVQGAAFADSAADSVHAFTNINPPLHSETISESADLRSSAVDTLQGDILGYVKEECGKKADEVKSISESVADHTKQTAENKVNETVESVRLSASETLTSWTESAVQKVSEVAGTVSLKGAGNTDSLEHESADEKQQHSAFDQSDFDPAGLTSTHAEYQEAVLQQVQNIRQSDTSHNAEDADNICTGASFKQQSEEARDFLQGLTTAADENSQEFSNEAINSFNSVQDTFAAESEEAWSEVPNAPHNFSDDVQEAYERSRTEDVADNTAASAVNDLFAQEQQEERSVLFADVEGTAKDSLQTAGEYAKDEVLKKVGFSEGVRTELSDEVSTNNPNNEFDQVPGDEDFLQRAKSLLEAHRSSLDGDRNSVPSVTVTEQDVDGSEQTSEQTAVTEESSHEATAREFVESIIEKATSLVSESLEKNEPASDSSSPSDPVVERGEETLAPKKRGVMFMSPQISDRSSSSLSSPQEISPPPPPQEPDLSPLADSSSSSISQCELVETEELLVPPPLPAEFSLSENNNNNNNIVNNNAEDDDESIQRVAMEVTAKAVQDAIKIVAENGTGLVLNPSDVLNNGNGVSSPSSPDNEDEEMTTTDSSQVERGSPVSDLTDTSVHGSVSESLSSYDPGAVFRQDVTNMADLTSAPSGSSTEPHPETEWAPETSISKPHDKMADLINFEEGSTSHAETPTPTNATTFDTYPHPPSQVSSDYSSINFLSDVPSSFHPLDELPSSPNKPMIVINSPDSAHHTNGSCEDVSSPQTEALI